MLGIGIWNPLDYDACFCFRFSVTRTYFSICSQSHEMMFINVIVKAYCVTVTIGLIFRVFSSL